MHELALIGAGLAIALFRQPSEIVAWRWPGDWLWAGAFAVLAASA